MASSQSTIALLKRRERALEKKTRRKTKAEVSLEKQISRLIGRPYRGAR